MLRTAQVVEDYEVGGRDASTGPRGIYGLLRLLRLMSRSRAQLAAENLFLRKQLACYIERQVRPRRTDNASRITLVLL